MFGPSKKDLYIELDELRQANAEQASQREARDIRIDQLERQVAVYQQTIAAQKESNSKLLARLKEAQRSPDLDPNVVNLAEAVIGAIHDTVSSSEYNELFPRDWKNWRDL